MWITKSFGQKEGESVSRDWRPVEQYAYDNHFKEERGYGLRDSVITWQSPDGQEIPLQNEEMRKQFPELEFLWGEAKNIFEEHKNNKAVLSVLDEIEKAFKEAEKVFDETKSIPESKKFWELDENEFMQLPLKEVASEWFYGNLDSNFYYNTYNNDMLSMYVQKQIAEALSKEKGKSLKGKTEKGEERE